MQCFICVTYMIILCSASPAETREITLTEEKRTPRGLRALNTLSFFSKYAEDRYQNDDNNLSQNYDSYIYENEPLHMPRDSQFMPRRNDRIEMPSLKPRFPKHIIQPIVPVELENKPSKGSHDFKNQDVKTNEAKLPRRIENKENNPIKSENNKITLLYRSTKPEQNQIDFKESPTIKISQNMNIKEMIKIVRLLRLIESHKENKKLMQE